MATKLTSSVTKVKQTDWSAESPEELNWKGSALWSTGEDTEQPGCHTGLGNA